MYHSQYIRCMCLSLVQASFYARRLERKRQKYCQSRHWMAIRDNDRLCTRTPFWTDPKETMMKLINAGRGDFVGWEVNTDFVFLTCFISLLQAFFTPNCLTPHHHVRKSSLISHPSQQPCMCQRFIMKSPSLRRQTVVRRHWGGKEEKIFKNISCEESEKEKSEVLKVKLFESLRRQMMHKNTYRYYQMKTFAIVSRAGTLSRSHETLFQMYWKLFSYHSQIPLSSFFTIRALKSILSFESGVFFQDFSQPNPSSLLDAELLRDLRKKLHNSSLFNV